PLPGDGSGVSGEINPAGDEDWYSVTVVQGGSVEAETSDGMGGCALDTVLELVAPDRTTVLATNDDKIPRVHLCSHIDPRILAGARDVAAGTYFIHVIAFDPMATGAYTLTVTARGPQCGNGILDLLGATAEQCDDGNLASGDGCSATCQIE